MTWKTTPINGARVTDRVTSGLYMSIRTTYPASVRRELQIIRNSLEAGEIEWNEAVRRATEAKGQPT